MFWADDSDIFWPKNVEWLGLAGQRDIKFEFYNPYSLNGGKPVLIGIVSGNDAKYMEDNYGENAERVRCGNVCSCHGSPTKHVRFVYSRSQNNYYHAMGTR